MATIGDYIKTTNIVDIMAEQAQVHEKQDFEDILKVHNAEEAAPHYRVNVSKLEERPEEPLMKLFDIHTESLTSERKARMLNPYQIWKGYYLGDKATVMGIPNRSHLKMILEYFGIEYDVDFYIATIGNKSEGVVTQLHKEIFLFMLCDAGVVGTNVALRQIFADVIIEFARTGTMPRPKILIPRFQAILGANAELIFLVRFWRFLFVNSEKFREKSKKYLELTGLLDDKKLSKKGMKIPSFSRVSKKMTKFTQTIGRATKRIEALKEAELEAQSVFFGFPKARVKFEESMAEILGPLGSKYTRVFAAELAQQGAIAAKAKKSLNFSPEKSYLTSYAAQTICAELNQFPEELWFGLKSAFQRDGDRWFLILELCKDEAKNALLNLSVVGRTYVKDKKVHD
jgi:hypothetical protein